VPGHHHEHDDEEEEAEAPVRVDLSQRRFDLRGGVEALTGAIESVTVRFAAGDYEHVELEGEEVGTRFTNDATELRVEALQRAFGNWSGAFGVQLGEREFAAVGDEAFVPPVDTRSAGLFAVEQLELDTWEVSLGARVEKVRHEPSNGSPSFDAHATSFSFGAVRPFGADLAFVTTVALAERLPVAEELYSDGPHLATGVVQLGDSGLGGETARHLDVGVRGRLRQIDWSVTAFGTRYDDFIYLADTGAVDEEHELPIFGYTQAAADFRGFEAEMFVPLLDGERREIDLRLFADYVRGELASGEALPRLPPLRYGARFEYHDERLLAGLEATRYDEQDEVAPFEEATPGYLLLNADVRWRLVGVAAMELEVFVNASNLGDEEARKHTSFVKDSAPLPGRNYAVGVRSRF
jgi:iron complex outermembrane receptor protein